MPEIHKSTRRAIAVGISLYALSVSHIALAQSTCPDGSAGPFCEIDNSGSSGPVTGTPGTATIITNSGTITGNPAISQGQSFTLSVDNGSEGVIDGEGGVAIQGSTHASFASFSIINAGAINGDVIFSDAPFVPSLFTGSLTYYISDGGTLDGDLQLGAVNGYSTANFIQRGANDGVTGVITAGAGLDIYTKSYDATQSLALGQYQLPASFEIEGYEALGSDTTLTLTGSGSTIFLMGDGNVVNEATIGRVDTTGVFPPGVTVIPGAIGYGQPTLAAYRRDEIPLGQPGSFYTLTYGNALTSFTNNGIVNGDVTLSTASFVNNGELNLVSNGLGSIIMGAADTDFSFANSGTIEMVDNGARASGALTDTAVHLVSAINATVLSAVDIRNNGEIEGGLGFTGVASDFVFENTGTINMDGNPNGIDRAVEIELGWLEVALNPVFKEGAAANSVIINNGATGVLDGGIESEVLTRTFAFTNSGTINQDADDDEAEAVQLYVAGGNEGGIDAESASFINTGTIVGTVELGLDASLVFIDNSGNISRDLNPGSTLFGEGFGGLEVEQETTLSAVMNFTNSGTISTADYAGAAVSINIEAGSLESGVAGAETASATVNFTNSGTIAASGGSYLTPLAYFGQPANQVSLDFAAALAIITDAEGASNISITNDAGAMITARGPSHLGNPGGAQLIAGQPANASGLAVAALADTVTIVNNGTILGGQGFPLTLGDGTLLIPDVDLDVDFDGRVGTAIDTFASTDTITNGATGVIEGGIVLRGGDDTFSNYGSITGDIHFGTGNDSFIQGVNASFTGTAFGGDGEDRFQLDITGGTLNNAVYDQFVSQLDGFEVLGVTGSGNIDLSSGEPLPVETIELSGGETVTFGAGSIIETQGETAITGTNENNALVVLGTVNGNIDLGQGDNSFTLGGTIDGNIVFGTGSDTLVLQPGATITGTATGGGGFDSLSAPLTGTYEEPTILDLAQFESFEELNVTSGGVGTVAGDLVFETVNVNDGRLIGLAGSTISGDVNVSSDGIFGSAGTVNGDIGVEGTLSPGSSPGTMTVNGNVTLASGSTTLFEMTPTVSDALVINGSLTIETNTTLDITGERPPTPGVTYNLITTTDGITGSFTTINKADAVFGFISQTATALQLLGTFQLHDGANAQVVATNSYLNSLLINGQATAGLLAAAPDLVGSDGFASDSALATIHPEAYASVSQIGVENGLAISSALRSSGWAGRGGQSGLFTFGQGFGSWRNFKAESGTGASKADVRSSGFFGGVGYGNKNVLVSAFIGRVDAAQSIRPIGARNDADGTFFGATAELAFAGFRLGGSVVRDHSSADTSRVLFNGSEATSHYRLRGTTADIHAGYGFALGGGWDIGPEVGVTHVSVKRGEATETGAGAFNLTVAKDRLSYTFLTADLALQMSEGKLRPWLSAGLRQRLDNDRAEATASLTGVSTSFTVPGVQRDRSFGNVGAGVAWQVSTGLNLFARGNSEFGSDNDAESIDAGLRLRF